MFRRPVRMLAKIFVGAFLCLLCNKPRDCYDLTFAWFQRSESVNFSSFHPAAFDPEKLAFPSGMFLHFHFYIYLYETYRDFSCSNQWQSVTASPWSVNNFSHRWWLRTRSSPHNYQTSDPKCTNDATLFSALVFIRIKFENNKKINIYNDHNQGYNH